MTNESNTVTLGEIRLLDNNMFRAKYWLGKNSVVCVEIEQINVMGDFKEKSVFARKFTLNRFSKMKRLWSPK